MKVLAPLYTRCLSCGSRHSLDMWDTRSLAFADDGIPLATLRMVCATCSFQFTALQVLGVQA